jgi:flagellar biosynthetic protein FlhB
MPDQPAGDRTEKPTPERLRKARREGQVAQSQEVGSALITGMVVVMLVMLGPAMCSWFSNMIREGINAGASGPAGGEVFRQFMHMQAAEMLGYLAPILIVCGAMSCFASVLVGGFVFSPKALKLDWNRVNPVKGIKNVISLQALVRLLMSILKMTVIGVVCYLYVRERSEVIVALRWATPAEAMRNIGSLVAGLMFRVCIALLIIAGLDFAFQKWNWYKKLRMTIQEVKEERKQYEVAPEVKGRIRQIQIEMVRRRMLQDVPTADVVVTNPTHVAVALKYEMETMDAPVVLAKGPDELCARIKEIAREHDVPIIERPVLARTLYASCEVGQAIPSDMFVAVAEVLAMIFRMKKKRRKKV